MDFTLSAEQRRLRQLARTFAIEEIRPIARELDRREDPARAYPQQLIRRASALGLRTLKVPPVYGGSGADCLTEVLVLEELCVGDVGFGMTLQHAWREGYMLATATTDDQRERFLAEFLEDDTYVPSFAITEGHSGSDNALPYDDDLRAGPRTTAVLEGAEWVINGSKMFVSNSNVGRLVMLFARTDPTVPWTQGVSCLLVPNDTPGVRVGRVEDKLGIRLNQNAEIVFEDCRVPRGNLLGELHGGLALMRRYAAGSKTKEGAKSLGIARAAYEAALEHARAEGLAARQSVASLLADMACQLESARTLMWRSAWMVDHDPAAAGPYEDMVKVLTAEVGVRVARLAMDVAGSAGVARDRPFEKYLRDAVSMLHAGCGNHALRDRLGRVLASEPVVTSRP